MLCANNFSEAFLSLNIFLALLWTAPEHICNLKYQYSQPGDVYSYGIILQEIITREYPYHMFENMTAKGNYFNLSTVCFWSFDTCIWSIGLGYSFDSLV